MRLLRRSVVGQGHHRSGWPAVMDELQKLSCPNGVLLDDFADASFSYKSISSPYTEDWVGIFHHPVTVNSPLAGDRKMALRDIERHPMWRLSLPGLRGAIALCDEVASELSKWLSVPVLSLKHPTDTTSIPWSIDNAIAKKQIVQVGYCLRNTQLIFQFDAPGWQRLSLFGASPHFKNRNEQLRRCNVRYGVKWESVKVLARQSNLDYDRLLANSVIVTELYGAAANNLVVECIARGTPIAINRLPAVVEYLGSDYPLYFSNPAEIAGLLNASTLQQASEHLASRLPVLPTFSEFANQVYHFARGLEQ